jgi:hypothetical protein
MEQQMPLARYFSFVGGVLLALMFVLDAFLPKGPVVDRADANLPVIRIHSERKWPERIVFDTSLPTIIPPQIASDEASILVPATTTDVSVKGREREAFAQMQPSDAKQLQPSNPKKREPKLQRKRKIARRHTAPQPFLAAGQMRFGWFRSSIWWGG